MPPVATAGRRKSKVPQDPILDAEVARVTNPTIEQLKSFGNRYYDLGDFRKAVRYYGNAIKLDPENAVLYSNRSAAYLQGGEQLGMDTTSMALRDATKACELRPDWAKAWTRKGDAFLQMDKPGEAADCFQRTVELDPTNSRAREQLAKCGGCAPRDDRCATPSEGGNLDKMVDTLNEGLTMNRKLSGKDYLQAEMEKFRLRRQGSMKQEAPTPKADEMTEKLGFTSEMANSYKTELLGSFRNRRTSGSDFSANKSNTSMNSSTGGFRSSEKRASLRGDEGGAAAPAPAISRW
jgi:tetratricopeptide (TPR) repeat protein